MEDPFNVGALIYPRRQRRPSSRTPPATVTRIDTGREKRPSQARDRRRKGWAAKSVAHGRLDTTIDNSRVAGTRSARSCGNGFQPFSTSRLERSSNEPSAASNICRQTVDHRKEAMEHGGVSSVKAAACSGRVDGSRPKWRAKGTKRRPWGAGPGTDVSQPLKSSSMRCVFPSRQDRDRSPPGLDCSKGRAGSQGRTCARSDKHDAESRIGHDHIVTGDHSNREYTMDVSCVQPSVGEFYMPDKVAAFDGGRCSDRRRAASRGSRKRSGGCGENENKRVGEVDITRPFVIRGSQEDEGVRGARHQHVLPPSPAHSEMEHLLITWLRTRIDRYKVMEWHDCWSMMPHRTWLQAMRRASSWLSDMLSCGRHAACLNYAINCAIVRNFTDRERLIVSFLHLGSIYARWFSAASSRN